MFDFCRHRFRSILWSTSYDVSRDINPIQFMKGGRKNLKRLVGLLAEETAHQPRLRSTALKQIHRIFRYWRREVAVLGGGTLINRNDETLQRYNRVRSETRSYVPVFGTGVCAPEFYSLEPHWRDRRKEWVAALAELPVVGVRGPRSKELLDDAGACNVVVSGDPAVAFHLPYSKNPIREQAEPSMRIGINTGDCSGQLWGRTEDVQESLSGLVRWLTAMKHQVEIIPVWSQDVPACTDLARRTGVGSISRVCSTAELFLKKVETFDFFVALKLHAGILSAAANVPFVLLEYQPKCRDFALSLKWEQFTPRTDQVSETVLIDLVSSLIQNLPSRKRELCDRMCILMHRFEDYCREIEPILYKANRLAANVPESL